MELTRLQFSLIKKKLKIILRNYTRRIRYILLVKILRIKTAPSFVIAGVQKSGTSALAYFLNQHPDLKMSYDKEVNYFSSSKYKFGDNWYAKQFPARLSKTKYFEATPDYLYSQYFAERLYKYDKDIKIIIILRDPVKRAYSAWNMFKEINKNADNKSDKTIKNNVSLVEDVKTKEYFSEFIKSNNYPDFGSYINMELEMIERKSSLTLPGFLRYGLYYEQIKRLLSFFSKDQILIIENNQLKKDKVETLKKIFDFLNVNNSFDVNDISEVGVRNYEEPISDNDMKLLSEFYQPHNNKLFKLIGKKFNWD